MTRLVRFVMLFVLLISITACSEMPGDPVITDISLAIPRLADGSVDLPLLANDVLSSVDSEYRDLLVQRIGWEQDCSSTPLGDGTFALLMGRQLGFFESVRIEPALQVRVNVDTQTDSLQISALELSYMNTPDESWLIPEFVTTTKSLGKVLTSVGIPSDCTATIAYYDDNWSIRCLSKEENPEQTCLFMVDGITGEVLSREE